MKKNNTDQTFEPGKVATASGYTWKTKPGPENILVIDPLFHRKSKTYVLSQN